MEKEKLAKEIFLKYSGSHFYMDREGEYEYYKSFNISDEQEQQWIKDYLQETLNIIKNEDIVSDNFINFATAITQFKDIYHFEQLINLVKSKNDHLDSFSRMRMAEDILNIVESLSRNWSILMKNASIISEGQQLAFNILKDILKKPISIAQYYQNLDYLEDEVKDNSVVDRVKRLLKKQ